MKVSNKFKGTRGNWILNEKYQTIVDSEGYGIAQQNGIKNSEKWLEDSLLISKAPEMLEMLQTLSNLMKENVFLHDTSIKQWFSNTVIEVDELIKQATEL